MPFALLGTAERVHAHYRNAYKGLLDDAFDSIAPLEELAGCLGAQAEAFLPDPPRPFPEFPPELAGARLSSAAEATSILPEVLSRIRGIVQSSQEREALALQTVSALREALRRGAAGPEPAEARTARVEERLRRELEPRVREELEANFRAEKAALIATITQQADQMGRDISQRMEGVLARERELQQRAASLDAEAARLREQEASLLRKQDVVAQAERSLQSQSTALQQEIARQQSYHQQRLRDAASEIDQIRAKRGELEQTYASERVRRERELEALERQLEGVRAEVAGLSSQKEDLRRQNEAYLQRLEEHQRRVGALREEARQSGEDASLLIQRSEYLSRSSDELIGQVAAAVAQLGLPQRPGPGLPPTGRKGLGDPQQTASASSLGGKGAGSALAADSSLAGASAQVSTARPSAAGSFAEASFGPSFGPGEPPGRGSASAAPAASVVSVVSGVPQGPSRPAAPTRAASSVLPAEASFDFSEPSRPSGGEEPPAFGVLTAVNVGAATPVQRPPASPAPLDTTPVHPVAALVVATPGKLELVPRGAAKQPSALGEAAALPALVEPVGAGRAPGGPGERGERDGAADGITEGGVGAPGASGASGAPAASGASASAGSALSAGSAGAAAPAAPPARPAPPATQEPPRYRIPERYDPELGKESVPVADWARAELLSRCIAHSATVNPDSVFPLFAQKPTVYELFRIQNHPYDNRGRFTQEWGRDKLSREEIRHYNAEMGFSEGK